MESDILAKEKDFCRKKCEFCVEKNIHFSYFLIYLRTIYIICPYNFIGFNLSKITHYDTLYHFCDHYFFTSQMISI